ncbi:RTA1 domain-containing protein [Ascoidea rubescens DSM 1968]|uniref:RTA1-domain-containing protein n=1 Tax=Ascoidea rubescens DSM 1968 TaxID=1344418 RepID=A0A1D2VPH5_9ASCO|nr:RTA1-domain-containing protein [Ascoidea rubescens DSM 1968]ODV63522.1 RTA1-domain-containing protein [Ascoidea rubescens DSM 1968]
MSNNSLYIRAAADYLEWEPYNYTPSLPAAIVFAILYSIVTLLQIVQIFRARTQYLSSIRKKKGSMGLLYISIPLVLGSIFEVIGYIGRAISSQDEESLGPYIIQSIFLLVAPALFAASIYMYFGRCVNLLDSKKSCLISTRFLTKIFVSGDLISFLMQGGGGGIMAKGTQSASDLGENLIVGGLFVQLGFFGIFMVISLIYFYKIGKNPTSKTIAFRKMPSKYRNWYNFYVILYITSILIMIRSIVRVVEFIQGSDGEILSNEIYLYVFDGLMMLLVMILFYLINTSGILLFLNDDYNNINTSLNNANDFNEGSSTYNEGYALNNVKI